MRIRYYGHFGQSSGYGQAARHLARALDRHQIDLDLALELKPIGRYETDPGMAAELFQPITNPDAIIVHTLPGDCHRVLEIEGLRRGAGPKLIAYTTWEATSAPLGIAFPLFKNFDQVWVPSRATASAFTEHPRRSPPQVIPHCYDETVERPRLKRPDRERFLFYWIGTWTARKNPGGLLRAFVNAFGPDDQVELMLQSAGCSMDTFVAALAATGLQQDELPKITLGNRYMPDDAIRRMHEESDCFVTASRGEAWNLPAFDAMLAGRHVIAQAGLGSDDYLADTSAYLIDGAESPAQVDVIPVRSDDGSVTVKTIGAQGLTSRSLWLDPDLCELSRMMRSTFEDRTRTLTINYDPAERFGYAAVAKLVLNVLENP